MDRLIDQFASAAPNNQKSEKERIDAVLSHPLFMSNLGEFGEEQQQENQETINAIQSLVFDGTPKGIQVNFNTYGGFNACMILQKWRKTLNIKEMLALKKVQESTRTQSNSTRRE